MATGIVRPNSPTVIYEWLGGGSTDWQQIDDDVEDPADGDDVEIAADKDDDGDIEVWNFTSILSVDEVTQIVVKVRNRRVDAPISASVDINLGGWIGAQGFSPQLIEQWHTFTFSGLSGSQANLDGLQVKITLGGMGDNNYFYVDVVYCIITYSELSGWGHKFNDVAPANIAKINGVSIQNILKINDLA